jgi:MOSC domain-containing protein YiiM
MGQVVKLIRYRAKGEPGEEVSEAALREGLGLDGDFHAGPGDRQLCILPMELRAWIDGKNGQGLCFPRFRENISIEGIAPADLAPGRRLALGGAVVEISGSAKHCHEECPLYQAGAPCLLAGAALFAKVLQGGPVRVGDLTKFI